MESDRSTDISTSALASGSGGGRSEAPPSSSTDVEVGVGSGVSKRSKPKPLFISLFRILNLLAGTSALLCLVGNCMALATGHPLTESGEMARSQIIRLYTAGLAVLVMLVEAEWEWFLSYVKILDSWLFRGLLQGFLAILTLEVATSKGTSDFDRSLVVYRQISGICMLSMAGLYCLGGMLCCGFIKRVTYRREADRLKMERDLQLISRQQEELKGLLAVYNDD